MQFIYVYINGRIDKLPKAFLFATLIYGVTALF